MQLKEMKNGKIRSIEGKIAKASQDFISTHLKNNFSHQNSTGNLLYGGVVVLKDVIQKNTCRRYAI